MDLDTRARLHAALGERARLAVVDALVTSDRSPSELSALLDLPSNLLAHHLDVLQSVGLIERIESTGDRRRRYLRLRRDRLEGLHRPRTARPERVTFVCTHNSARSQLAAALWTARTGSAATSSGTHPAERVNPRAVSAARRAGLDIGDARPREFRPDEHGGLVVTVCDRAHEELDPDSSWWHWSIPDPVEIDTDAAFDTTIVDLRRRIIGAAADATTDLTTDATQRSTP